MLPVPGADPSSPPGELVAKSWLGKGGGGSPFPQLLAGRILPRGGFPGQPGQRRKAELLCSKKNTGTFLGTGSASLLSDGKKELEEANMKKAGEGWKDLGTARNGGRPGRGQSPVPVGPSLGQYRLEGLQAGHVSCTKKSLHDALSPSFPLADVHPGEGGGLPVQPARVQHHRLHLRSRGTDVSVGPLRR